MQTSRDYDGAMHPCISCLGVPPNLLGALCPKKWHCNPIHSILEFYKVLVQFPFIESKTELDN